MKKLLFFAATLLALTSMGHEYSSSYYAWLEDQQFEKADSVLTLWEQNTPDDPELYPARFNYWINKAVIATLLLSTDLDPRGEYLSLSDSSGNPAGTLSDHISWNDSILNLALTEIDRGIAAYPDRLDFLFGKAKAAAMSERWGTLAESMADVFDRCATTGYNNWTWTNCEPFDSAKQAVQEFAYEHLIEFFTNYDSITTYLGQPLSEKAADLFPDNIWIVNIAGGFALDCGNREKALEYFQAAHRIDPTDGIALANIAHITFLDGDTAQAVEIFRQIADDDSMDPELRESVRNTIEDITTPLTKMKKYAYFFSYLPEMASQIPQDAEYEYFMSDPYSINTGILRRNHELSPFTDEQIKAQKIDYNGTPIYVWTFPMPEECPLCLYVAFVPEKDKDGHRLITLEKSLFVPWVLGEAHQGSHSNFGEIDEPSSPEDFVNKFMPRISDSPEASLRINKTK